MLPTPNLDDRRFQQLVDDAKRLIAARCPEWSDHNVSDPGVTLIEAFAFMVDELHYRLNRVPDRLYITFLDLLGVTLHPPAPARAELLFRLSAPDRSRSWSLLARRRAPGDPMATSRSSSRRTRSSSSRRAASLISGGGAGRGAGRAHRGRSSRGRHHRGLPVSAPRGQRTPLRTGRCRAALPRVAQPRVQCARRRGGPHRPAVAMAGMDRAFVEGLPDRVGWHGRPEPERGGRDPPTGGARGVGHREACRAGWVRCVVTEPTHERQPAYTASPLVHKVGRGGRRRESATRPTPRRCAMRCSA